MCPAIARSRRGRRRLGFAGLQGERAGCTAARAARPDHRRRNGSVRRRLHGRADEVGPDRRRRGRRREGRPGVLPEGLWLRGHGEAHAGGSGADAVPSRLGLEAVHLDGDHAAGRAGQDRSRRRRQHVPEGLQGRRDLPRAGEGAQHHDAHRRLRGRRRRLPVRGHGRRSVAARRMAGFAPAGARSAADDRLQRWHERVVFELGHGAGRTHRRGRFGPVVRRVHRAAHLPAARHGAQHLPRAAAGAAGAAHVRRLQLRSRRVQAARLRVHPRRRPRRVDDFDRRGHGALHARAPAGRRTGRRAHPQAGNGAADAQARDEPGRRAERPRTRLLRNVHQRSPHHRSRRRHAVFPLRAEPDAGNRHRPVRDGEHRRPWRQGLGRARACFLQALLSRGAAAGQAAR